MMNEICTFRPLIFATVAPIIKHPQNTEDVVSEVLYKAFLKSDAYNPEMGAVSTWLKTIARNTAIDFVRRASNRCEKLFLSEDVIYESCSDNVLVAVEYDDRAYQIEMSIKNLNERDQLVVRSYYYKRLSHSEIAELIGVKTNAVGVMIKRCNEKMKKDFSRRGLSERDF
jgi:RNA polymerase sigma-70 factor (ECF subfamily)